MPEPNGDRIHLRAYYDAETGAHKLEATPQVLRVCKRNTKVVAITATNETVKTKQYKAILLEYRIYDSGSKAAISDPERVFANSPNFPNTSFLVPDDGSPVYFMVREHLGIKERKTPCSFPERGPDEYSVVVRFAHEGWDDPAGSGLHHDLHWES